MRRERLMRYKEQRHENIRNAKYCDFDREAHIKRFNELPIETQVVLLRHALRLQGRKPKYWTRKSLEQRLQDYKFGKEWLQEFGVK